MQDRKMFGHIEDLIAEEERLYAKPQRSAEDRARLDAVKVELDQCWDLLRQRHALRDAGKDPDQARVRDPGVVEHYQQ